MALIVRKTYSKKIIFLILLLSLFSRIILISRELPLLDGKLIPDDSYLSWQIAKNIANGFGPKYSGNYTNGFQPLYVFVVSPFFRLFSDPVAPIKCSLFVLAIFDTATLAVILLWVHSFSSSRFVLMITGLLWVVNDYIIRTSLNGLETIMSGFFITLGAYFFYRIYFLSPQKRYSQFFILGIIIGFACFTRVDNLILALIIGLFILFYERRKINVMLTSATLFSIGVLLIFSIWIIYSNHYLGFWYPESGKAVRFQSLANVNHHPTLSWYGKMIVTGAKQILFENGGLAVLMLFIFIYGKIKQKFHYRFSIIMPLAIFCISIFLAYTLYIFTPWYFDRYFFPFAILFILAFAILLDSIVKNIPSKTAYTLYGSILLFWIAIVLVRGKYADYFIGPENKDLGYMNLALWAKQNLPDSSVVGCSQSGALGYFATNLEVINLDGVVNKECFISLQQKKNIEYIKSVHMNYILGWTVNIDFIKKHSENIKEADISLVNEIKGFRSWNQEWYLYRVNQE